MQRRSALTRGVRALSVVSLVAMTVAGPAHADVDALTPGQWSGGAGVGFLANTPDGDAEFALKGFADYFLMPRFSVGPLAQYAGAGNDFLFGLSGQAKYWWDFLGSRNAKLVVQGGIGFVRAGIKDTDSGVADTYTSFLIPVGVGLDYTVTKQLAVTADFFLNFTSLGETVRVGGREVDLHTNVMPGLYLGVRF
ncbi:MAG: outer membrane beta-barrel protein [Candidatus Rokuibacteriota bacterium]